MRYQVYDFKETKATDKVQTKLCSRCNKIKLYKEFSKDYSHKTLHQARCKTCDKERLVEYRKTINGFIAHLYSHQKRSSKVRRDPMPTYSRNELKDWLYSRENFISLFNQYKLSGFDKMLAPSVDRLNDYKGYSIDNIQLITWEDNKLKGEHDRKYGINTKSCKAVLQFDLNDNFIAEYHSSGAAARAVNGVYTTICQCCRGGIKTSSGFKWAYKNEH